MKKEEIEVRMKDLDTLIAQQSQLAVQVNNQILMMHGAKQELDVWLKKIDESCEHKCETATHDDCVDGA